MNRILALLLFFLVFSLGNITAQNKEEHIHSKACGTLSKTKEEKAFSLNYVKNQASFKNTGTTCVGLAIHVVNMDDGSGGVDNATLAQGIANVNYKYLPAGIEFFICSIDSANDTDLYDYNRHSSDSDGVADVETDLVALFTESTDALNVYVVNTMINTSGNSISGYAYYPNNSMTSTRMVIKSNRIANAVNGTFAHEFGHMFDLSHTHDGTEDGNTDPDAERVVRTGPDANCATNGDTFCDTDADPKYLSADFDSGSCSYTGTAQDNLGVTYTPTTAITNIMSYYPDACGGVFTTEQYAHMALALTTRLAHTVYDLDGCTPASVTAPSGLTGVQNGGVSIDLTWTDNASNELGYLIERSTTSSSSGFSAIPFGGTGDNATSFSDMDITSNTTYWYRVKAVNGSCNSYSNVFEITTTLAYCTPTYNFPCENSTMESFSMDGDGGPDEIDNAATGCSGASYSDYTLTHSATVTTGSSYSFSICRNGSNTRYAEVWVDFNHDGDFDDVGETIIDASVTASACYNGTLTVPQCTAFGATTMRVMLASGAQPTDPCGTYSWGETEDYTLNIQPQIATNTGSIVTRTADYDCTDAEGWTHYWDNMDGVDGGTDDVLLLSLYHGTSGLSITPGDVTVRLDATTTNTYLDGTGFITGDPGSYGVLFGRTFDVNYGGALSSNVGVKFYYPTTEYDDLNTTLLAAPISGVALTDPTQLKFYKVTSADSPWDIANIAPAEAILLDHGASPTENTWTDGDYSASVNYSHFEVSSFSGGGGGGKSAGGNLPIELTRFVAERKGSSSILHWTTLSEINNDYFLVEHSVDGYDFRPLGKVKSAGNSISRTNYQYTHLEPSLGINYYRLTQFDFDGASEKFGPVSVLFKTQNLVNVFPVPARTGRLNMAYHAIRNGEIKWEIYNANGMEISQGTETVNSGMNRFLIVDDNLTKGMYYLRVGQENGETESVRFIVAE